MATLETLNTNANFVVKQWKIIKVTWSVMKLLVQEIANISSAIVVRCAISHIQIPTILRIRFICTDIIKRITFPATSTLEFDPKQKLDSHPLKHTGVKTHFISRNSLDFDISKMWILWKLRFQKGEFCEKWDFRKVNSVKIGIL